MCSEDAICALKLGLNSVNLEGGTEAKVLWIVFFPVHEGETKSQYGSGHRLG